MSSRGNAFRASSLGTMLFGIVSLYSGSIREATKLMGGWYFVAPHLANAIAKFTSLTR